MIYQVFNYGGILNSAFTFDAPDDEIASLLLLVHDVRLGAKSADGKHILNPYYSINSISAVDAAESGFEQAFGRTPECSMGERMHEYENANTSILFGTFEDRIRYERCLALMPTEELRKQFIWTWWETHDCDDMIMWRKRDVQLACTS